MRLEFLYRSRFRYPEGWSFGLAGSDSAESQHFFLAEGICEGAIKGRMRGANHPLRRGDGTFQPDFQGIVETEDGAVIYFDWRGYGRSYPAGRRQIVASAIHLSDHPDYRWLNDVVCVGVGEVRTLDRGVELVVDCAQLIWEALPEEVPG